jgi:4-oxalocrotonate tautomerase
MPVINIQIARSTTREQKAQAVAEITDVMVRIFGSNPQATHIIFNEKSTEDWGSNGELIADRQARQG